MKTNIIDSLGSQDVLLTHKNYYRITIDTQERLRYFNEQIKHSNKLSPLEIDELNHALSQVDLIDEIKIETLRILSELVEYQKLPNSTLNLVESLCNHNNKNIIRLSENLLKNQQSLLPPNFKNITDIVDLSTRNSNKLQFLGTYTSNFRNIYKSFDQELVISKLGCGYKLDQFFHLQVPKELKYVTRKHLIIHEDLTLLCNDIISKNTDNKTSLLLSQTVKYSIRKGSEVEFNSLINVLKTSDSEEIKSEITYALGYKIKNSKELIKQDIIKEIKQSISDGINAEAKSFLNDQIQKQQDISNGNAWKVSYGKIKVSTNYSRNVPQAVVTKNQQTIKISYKNSQSEESTVNILSLADALKNRNKKIKINSNAENLPTVPDKGGDDRSFFSGTYVNVKNLYQKAINNQPIKSDDKDNYLVNKFIENSKWYANNFNDILNGNNLFGNFLTDRLISATFFNISKQQKLHNNAINKLILCLNSVDNVKENILGLSDSAIIAKKIAGCEGLAKLWYNSEPQIVKNIADKLYKHGLTEVKIGYFSWSYSYYPNQINEIISSEISGIRLDAVQAVYNCAVRDKKILTKERLSRIQNCLNDSDVKFRGMIIKILCLVDNDNIDYRTLFSTNISELERNVNTESAIAYINNQTKDQKRCKELFDKKIILRLTNLLRSSSFDNQTKVYYCEIINNCLEYSFTKGLDNEGLKNCNYIIDNTSSSNELKAEALRSILLTAEKAKTLPGQVVQSLVKNLDSFDDKSANFVVMTLGTICEKSEIKNINEVSNKLLDDRVIVGEGNDITFEQRSKDNLACSSISSIASKVFVNSLQNGTKITEKSLEHLISALDSNDKQTRILSAKSLSMAASNSVIANPILVKLREYVEDRIPDVATYTATAYTKGLAKLAQGKSPIAASHIEFLPAVYAFEDLRLGDENFTEQVNKNVLSVLLNEAGKQEFDEKVFRIFDHILFSDESNNKEAINILEHYTTNKYKIPGNTIAALENALGIAEVSDKAINVLKNVIRNGQAVSDKTLQIFVDHLYLSEDKTLRLKSFELLDIAGHNQDLSDEIFDKVELERAGHVIAERLADKEGAVFYLNKQTDEGQKLPINTFEALTDELDHDQVLSILSNVSKNKQIIPNYLIDKLAVKFDPKQKQSQLVEIFASIAKNNQNISTGLLTKLEKALDNKLISDQILSIFALQGQKGESLSIDVINRICNKFLTTGNRLVKQELSSAISSIIQKENKFDQSLVKKALIHGLTEENQNIVSDSVNGFKALANKISLDEISINALIEKASNIDCAENIKQNISLILNFAKLAGNQATKLKLANLNYDSNDKLLDEISKLSKQSDLLEQNFKQIQLIIDRESDLQHRAIDVLVKCSNKKDIPEELINSIATLMTSTNSNEIKTSCCKLIGQIAETGRKVTDRVISLVANEEDQKLAQHTLGLISKNQVVSSHAGLLLRIDSTPPSISTKDLSKLLKNVYKALKNGFKLTDSCVQRLLLIKLSKHENKDYSNIKEFADVFALTMQQQPEYSLNKEIVNVIEQAVLSKKVNSNIINGYTKIIKSEKYQNLSGVIDSLADLLQEGNQSERLNLAMLACITSASEVAEIPEKGLVVLENNIDSSDENIRSLSFKGLRAAQDKGYKSEVFESWCSNVIANLEFNINDKVKPNLDLLDTVASLRYVDFSKITKKPQVQWARELLLSDLLARFKVSDGEKFNFYKSWLDIEQQEQFQDGKSDKILKCLHNAQANNRVSFDQLNDVVKFLPNIDFKTAHNILLNNTNQYTDLKQQWLKTILNQHLQNKQVNADYIDKLASNIGTRFTTSVADKFLYSIATIENPREFELLLDFAEANKVKVSDIYVQNATVDELKRSLEIKFLGNQIQRSVDRYKLANTIDSLLDTKWTFEQLTTIFSNLRASNTIEKAAKEKSLIQVLEILDQYKLSPTNYKNVLTALNKSSEEWLKEVNTIAVDNNFQTIGKVKNTVELLEEVKTKNLNNESLLKLINNDLSDLIEQVKSTKLKSSIDLSSDLVSKVSNEISNLLIDTKVLKQTTSVISEWTRDDITVWASIVKSNSDCFVNSNFTTEALAVIKRANFLETGFHMTDSQILSCLVALNANQTQGRLLQVATGEGKSTIVSVLAIINALKGKKVDIITSSPVLAERDAKEKAKLYKMFGLNCSDNNDKSIYIKGAKDCYKKDIVYGEAAQFQFDALRDEYSQLGTLAGRKCEVAIVDEVDSMLIDDSSKIARLATTVAGLDQLQPIYHFLWQRLVSMQEKVVEIDGKMYLLYGKLSYEQDKMVLEYADDKGDIIHVPDLKNYIKSTEDISNVGQPIEGEIEVFLKKHLEDYAKELISKNVVKIPSNFKEFIEKQTPKWINNAVIAFNYQENTHYIVQEGVIKPVDFNSTGIVQSSTNWSDGLHQFLQIKHSLKMTSETFTTNFLSNMGYFKRYGSNLFGLTGTLGSEKAKAVLSDVYNVDLVNIPNLRKKQYLELPTIVTANETKWLNQICSSAINEANKERGTLIICETIEHTKIIAQKLREEYRAGAIKLYTMNNMNQEREVEKINPGEIIIATNLAGRGTDIKTDDIEKNGGMHVIVTFMPSNQRVEEQAFGRTARQGKRGTGQMILNAVNLIEYGGVTPQQVKELRNNFESGMLDEFQKKELKVIATKDKLFNEFCSLLNEIRQDIREKSGIWKQFKDSVKDIVINVIPSVHETNVLSAIEEQWAMFLRKVDDEVIPIEQADQEYKKFSDQIKKDYDSGTVIKNPYYHIAIANDLVINDSSLDDKYKKAIEHFEKALTLDANFSAAAYVGKAWLLLKGKERFWTANDQSVNYKQQAIIEFDKALGVLNDEMASLNAMQAVLQQQHTDIKSDLSKQLIQKVNILGSYSSSIQNAVSTIKKSQRLIDITGVRKYQNTTQYETKGEDSIERDDYNTEISKVETSYYGIARNSEGRIAQSLGSYDEFEVIFNDLTAREDSGTIDQAVNTINEAFSGENESSQSKLNKLKNIFVSSAILDSKKYKGISINLKQLSAERLQAMLNPNIEIKEATKEVAIAQLKDKSSFFHRHLLPERWSPDSSKINLEIILDNEKLETQKNLQARDVLKILEKQKDDNLRFNLTFINSNEVSKLLQKEILPNSSLSIECIGLDWQNAQNKFQQIESKAFSLEITGSKEELTKAIDHPKVKTVQFFNSEKNISETMYNHEAKKKIDQIKSENLSIRIENLDSLSDNEIINLCRNASFNINFIAVNHKASLQGLNEGQINVNFDNLGGIEATKLIPNIRKENMDFGLVFKHLNTKQVEGIIQKASLDQENIEISKVKTLNELFMDEAKPALELSEFAARGIEYLLEINEKRFVPWRSVIAVGALAAIQMAAGGVLIATGFGATVGMGLITEGAADIFTAYRAYSTRQFTWSDYMKQKAVSLIISAACMGLQAIKDAGKGIKNIAVGVGEEVLEQAGTQVVTNGKTIGKTLVQSGTNLKSLAFKQMGVATGEAAMREGLNKVADTLSHFALEQFKPQISASIQNKVNTKFCQSNLMSLVRKFHALDSISNSHHLKEKVDKILAETINPEHNFWKKQWDSVGGPLCKGILSDSKLLGSPFSMGMRILGTLNGMHQITFIVDNVHDQLAKKLSQIDKEALSMPQLLHQHCQIEQKDSREIVEILRKEDIIQIEENNNTASLDHALHHIGNVTLKELNPLTFHHEYVNPLAFDTRKEFKTGINQLSKEQYNPIVSEYRYHKIPKTTINEVDLHRHNQHKNKVVDFCALLNKNTLSVQIDDLSQIMKSISDIITEQVIRITESQLISPWSSYGMGALTNAISSGVQDKIIRNFDKTGKEALDEQKKELEGLENKENKTEADLRSMKQLTDSINGKQTYSGLINHEAKKYTIAYSQCENIHYAQQRNKNSTNINTQVSKEVSNHAEAVKKDKPADLADMFTMATENGIDLKIVDDPNYQLTEEEKAKGTKVVVFSKGDKNIDGKEGIGHYQLVSSDGKLIDIPSNDNDCGYAVFAELTGKSVEQLRNETAQGIKTNSENFVKAIEAQNWIQSHYPQEANSLLFSGGIDYEKPLRLQNIIDRINANSFSVDDAEAILEMCNKRSAYLDSPIGHSDNHEYSGASDNIFDKESHGLFLNKNQQNTLFFNAIRSTEAINILKSFLVNNGNYREVITVPVVGGEKFIHLYNGTKQEVEINYVTCVFDKVGNRLHVQTFYPIGGW